MSNPYDPSNQSYGPEVTNLLAATLGGFGAPYSDAGGLAAGQPRPQGVEGLGLGAGEDPSSQSADSFVPGGNEGLPDYPSPAQTSGFREFSGGQSAGSMLKSFLPGAVVSALLGSVGGDDMNWGDALASFTDEYVKTKYNTAMGKRKEKQTQEDFLIKSAYDLKPETLVRHGAPPEIQRRIDDLIKKRNEALANDGVISAGEARELLALAGPLQAASARYDAQQKDPLEMARTKGAGALEELVGELVAGGMDPVEARKKAAEIIQSQVEAKGMVPVYDARLGRMVLLSPKDAAKYSVDQTKLENAVTVAKARQVVALQRLALEGRRVGIAEQRQIENGVQQVFDDFVRIHLQRAQAAGDKFDPEQVVKAAYEDASKYIQEHRGQTPPGIAGSPAPKAATTPPPGRTTGPFTPDFDYSGALGVGPKPAQSAAAPRTVTLPNGQTVTIRQIPR